MEDKMRIFNSQFNGLRRFLCAGLIAAALGCVVSLLPVRTAKCDEFGCDGNLCDRDHPCNRGCHCIYPEPGKLGHCEVWARK